MDMFSANQINFQEHEKMTLSLTFKKVMDRWNSTFVTGDPNHLSNIVTQDFICRPTHDTVKRAMPKTSAYKSGHMARCREVGAKNYNFGGKKSGKK